MNRLAEDSARSALLRCCGARRWAEAMVRERPFPNDAAVFDAAERVWSQLQQSDWLEAFAAHPRIGARGDDPWSRQEQAGMTGATEATRRALAEGNLEYERRFGYGFLICATGRGADEMLAELRRRLQHDPAREVQVAAEEQARITRLRLEKLIVS